MKVTAQLKEYHCYFISMVTKDDGFDGRKCHILRNKVAYTWFNWHRFNPCWTKIPSAAWYSQKKKKKGHHTSTLTIKEKNALKIWVSLFRHSKWSQVATMDMASDTCLYYWEIFWTASRPKTPWALLLAAASCKPIVSRSPLVTMQPFQTSVNPYITSTLLASSNPNSWQISYDFGAFCLYNPPPFCSPVEHNLSASSICLSQAMVINLA